MSGARRSTQQPNERVLALMFAASPPHPLPRPGSFRPSLCVCGRVVGVCCFRCTVDFTAAAAQSIPVPAKFCFHFANAYEDNDSGEVVVDLAETSYLKLDSDKESAEPVWNDMGESGGREGLSCVLSKSLAFCRLLCLE